ncbi:MAG: transglutaminase-like domain-containing protein [Candidatus Bathyarchaeia archaeon]
MPLSRLAVGLLVGILVGATVGYGFAFNQVGSLQAQVSTLQGQVSSRDAQIVVFQNETARLQAELSGNLTRIIQLQNEVSARAIEISQLNSTISSQQAQISTLEQEKAKLQSDLTEAQSKIRSYESQISTLQTKLTKAQSQISDLSLQVLSQAANISALQGQVASLQTQLAGNLTLVSQLRTWLSGNLTRVAQLQAQVSTLDAQVQSLTSQVASLQAQYAAVQNSLAASQLLYIGTALETYYDYVRANCYTFGLETIGEEKWSNYPNYYNISVSFAANLASHDIGNLWWPTLETGCDYYNYTGEYSYETSSRIMQGAMTLAGVYSSDSDVTKTEKILAFIHSVVHYEHRMLDHMWFPCETLAFRSGDCTSFSILAAAMLEAAGIKAAVAFFTNSTLGGHAMVLVHLDNLGAYGYWYYGNLTGYGLTSGRWILIEPQYASLSQQDDAWISYWSLKACAEVPYGP